MSIAIDEKRKETRMESTILPNHPSHSEDQGQVTRPRWLDWVEKNCKPKKFIYPRPKRKPTRWQRRGPMTRRDWARFYHWAAKKAVARPEPPPPEPPEMPVRLDKKGRPKKKPTFDEVLERVEEISQPRHVRERYVAPPKQTKFPFIPQIDPKRKPKRERGRPIDAPKIPKFFYHFLHEIEFWCNLKFPPLSRAALTYVASPNIIQLAKPRKRPPAEHCPVPKEKLYPRVRMSYGKWIEHKRRLEYLAKPQIRPPPRDQCTPAELAKGLQYIPFYRSPGKWKYRNFKYVNKLLEQPRHKRPGTKHCFCTIPFVPRVGGSMTHDQWNRHRKRLRVLASPIPRPSMPAPKRKVMSSAQWSAHQARLEQLSKPIIRPDIHTREDPSARKDESESESESDEDAETGEAGKEAGKEGEKGKDKQKKGPADKQEKKKKKKKKKGPKTGGGEKGSKKDGAKKAKKGKSKGKGGANWPKMGGGFKGKMPRGGGIGFKGKMPRGGGLSWNKGKGAQKPKTPKPKSEPRERQEFGGFKFQGFKKGKDSKEKK